MSEQPLTTEEIRNRVKAVQAVRFGDILPHPNNPKDHHPEQREAFRGAVRDVGFTSIPIAYHSERHNGQLTWADGHLRGSEVADYVGQVAILDIDDKEADYVIATTDPIAAMVRYDNEKLDALLREVNSGSAAVMDMLAGLAEGAGLYLDEKPIGAGGDEFDTAPLEGETRAKRGDLWQMGEHRLAVGDCTDVATVERLMDGERVAVAVTSPPYTDQREYEIGEFDWEKLMCGAFDQMTAHLEDDGHILVNLGLSHKNRRVDMYWNGWLDYAASNGFPLFGWYAWDKGSGMPGEWNGRLAPAHEWVFHFNNNSNAANKWIETTGESAKRGSSGKRFRQKDGSLKELTSPDKIGQPFKVPDSVIRITREMARGIHTQNHPAVYPVALPDFVIRTWSREIGEIVYDPFLGSGTTLIAAERLGRKCYGCEIEPRYADVILRRWEAESGQEAQLVERVTDE